MFEVIRDRAQRHFNSVGGPSSNYVALWWRIGTTKCPLSPRVRRAYRPDRRGCQSTVLMNDLDRSRLSGAMMCGMPVFTLDTSCVIHAVQQQEHATAIERLADAARAGRLSLWLTAAFEADMTRASSEHQRANLSWLARQPILQSAQGPFRLDYASLGGPDVLVSGAQALVIDTVEDVVLTAKFRGGRLRSDDPEFMAKWSRKINDVQHLAAHHMAGHDAFVTSDHDDIVGKRKQLWNRACIRVYTPDEAIRVIASQES